ncbi:MAG: ATP-dependent helicase [Candidatus Omnitrophica bacterium]|nr:ATP-dependent helicase [Candidatus Omnitrophota bacterium]
MEIIKTRETADFDFKKELNEEQLKVVLEASGPSLVLAGPGSGKTRTIIYRTIYLLKQEVKPSSICLLSFTNKAAMEMVKRIEDSLGVFPKNLIAGTFHHVGNLFLRRYANTINLTPNYLILDRDDSVSLIKDILKGTAYNNMDISPEIIKTIISLSVSCNELIKDTMEKNFLWLSGSISRIESVNHEYSKRKKELGVVDYDDLLSLWLKLFSCAETAGSISSRFEHILVDEYQDTNRLQALILYQLARNHKNIMVVGDDAQSIYSFRGATIQNILEFPKVFPGAKVFYLRTNYRSTPEILHIANNEIGHNRYQFPKELKSVRTSGVKPVIIRCKNMKSEGVFVTQRINELIARGIKPSEIGVLFRSRYQAAELEINLNRMNVPYLIRGGVRFFEQAHIKDVIAFFKIIHNFRDEISWQRILKLASGIGKVYQEKIMDEIKTFSSIDDVTISRDSLHISDRAKKSFENIITTIKKIKETDKISSGIDIILDSYYKHHALNNFTDAEERLNDIESLKETALFYSDIEEFLSQLTLQEYFRGELHSNHENVILSTIHQAKGLEWKVVFVIGVCANHFPHHQSTNDITKLEEERRIFYVGITRAKEDLYLTYYVSDFFRNISFRKSIFIQEIDNSCVEEWSFD